MHRPSGRTEPGRLPAPPSPEESRPPGGWGGDKRAHFLEPKGWRWGRGAALRIPARPRVRGHSPTRRPSPRKRPEPPPLHPAAPGIRACLAPFQPPLPRRLPAQSCLFPGRGAGAGSLPNLGSPQTCRGRSSCLHPRTPQPTCGTSGDSGGWPDKGLAQGSRGLDRSRGPRATVASTPAARLRGKGRGGGEEMLPTGPICPAPPKARTPGVGSPGPLPAAGEPPSAYLVSRKVRGLGKHLEARAGPGTSSSWSFPTSHQCASR